MAHAGTCPGTLVARLVVAAGVALALVAAAGCTICPDPFDYSGPVPNGSAAQNDVRVRANGILPVSAHPVPWPPVVQAGPDAAGASDTATAAESPVADAVDDGAARVIPAAAEHASTADAPSDSGATDPQPAAEPGLEVILPPAVPQRPEILPPLRETPGWRPRG